MSRNWTEQEREILRLNYEHLRHKDLGLILGRSEGAVRHECWKLGLRKGAPNWTDEEITILKTYYYEHQQQSIDLAKLERMLPKRCKTNICRRARELGLTDQRRPHTQGHVTASADGMKQWHKTHEHPKGHLGHKHSEETRAIMSQKSRECWADPDFVLNGEEYRQSLSDRFLKMQTEGKLRTGYSRCRGGMREDIGIYVRSAWEANYARYLNWLVEQDVIQELEYEPDTFYFDEIKRGTRSYTPDFKITTNDGTIEYHEVKGWMDAKSKTKLKRMKKYHPDVKIILVDEDAYRAIQRDVSVFIPSWER